MTEMLISEATERGNPAPELPIAGHSTKEADEVSLLDVMILLAERKRLILTITAVFAILAIVTTLLLSNSYTATVTLLPPQQNSSMGAAMISQLGSLGGMAALAGGGLGLKNPNDMYVGMLKSRTVEDAMVQHFALMKEYHTKYLADARNAFEHHVSVDGSGKDGLIRISVVAGDPRRAADLANGYIDQFRNLSQNLAITEASQRRVFFERELEKAKNSLADAEEALKKTEQTTGLIQLDSQARALIESAASLRAEITAREVQIEGMETYATGQNAQLVQAQRELDGLRAQLAKLGGSEDSGNGELIVPKGKVPEAGLEYMRKLRDVKYSETIFELLARQFELAKLDEAKEGSLIQVVDAAVPPDKKSGPKRGFIVIGTTMVGFLVGIVWVLAREGFERMKGNPATNDKIVNLKRALSVRRPHAS
jgi:uncharacterized protein involved in exopolysaccharide biosynthesis